MCVSVLISPKNFPTYVGFLCASCLNLQDDKENKVIAFTNIFVLIIISYKRIIMNQSRRLSAPCQCDILHWKQ